jgi:hypothetical protein
MMQTNLNGWKRNIETNMKSVDMYMWSSMAAVPGPVTVQVTQAME